MADSATVVGRESERDTIRSWFRAARPSLLHIAGVAGIGRTTLWTSAVDLAVARGDRLMATARGDLADALGQLDRALAVYDTSLAMPFERARTLYARGQAHRRAGHRRAARTDLQDASAIFADLGAQAWLRRVAFELGRIGGRTPIGSALTTSERRVAERAAAGRSSRDIAAELMISIRTVESHLAAVYRKLGMRSRGQLAAALRALSEDGE